MSKKIIMDMSEYDLQQKKIKQAKEIQNEAYKNGSIIYISKGFWNDEILYTTENNTIEDIFINMSIFDFIVNKIRFKRKESSNE